MENITGEKPSDALFGRKAFSVSFMVANDFNEKIMLDIGCGYGWFELAANENKCKKIYGIEPSEKGLITARKHIQNKNIIFMAADAFFLPFEKNTFDTIVCWEVLEHLPKNSEMRLFNEMHRVLKPSGHFYLSTPNSALLSKFSDPAWLMMGHRHYSRGNIIAIAKKSHFQVEKIIIKGAFWEILSILNLYVSKWIFRRKPFFEKFLQKKQDKEYLNDGFNTIFMKAKKV
ncbi:MAG: class I SAM-dependent methyltransferase [archaeon]